MKLSKNAIRRIVVIIGFVSVSSVTAFPAMSETYSYTAGGSCGNKSGWPYQDSTFCDEAATRIYDRISYHCGESGGSMMPMHVVKSFCKATGFGGSTCSISGTFACTEQLTVVPREPGLYGCSNWDEKYPPQYDASFIEWSGNKFHRDVPPVPKDANWDYLCRSIGLVCHWVHPWDNHNGAPLCGETAKDGTRMISCVVAGNKQNENITLPSDDKNQQEFIKEENQDLPSDKGREEL